MLLVAMIYALGAVTSKKAILHSSVMFFSIYFFLCLNLCFLAGILFLGKTRIDRLLAKPVRGVVAGGLLFVHVICHGWAISMTKAVYMITIKRMSILFGIIYGGVLFREKHMTYRLLGTCMMVMGAVLVTLKG